MLDRIRAADGTIVTKHDREQSQRENGKRIMEFPPGIETGDGGGFDMQLSNQVCPNGEPPRQLPIA